MKTMQINPMTSQANLANRPGQRAVAEPSQMEDSRKPLAWVSRRKLMPEEKSLVRRLVEKSWVIGFAAVALFAMGCHKNAESAETPVTTGAKVEGGAVVFPPNSSQLASISVERCFIIAETGL